jgi:hypothetical protein
MSVILKCHHKTHEISLHPPKLPFFFGSQQGKLPELMTSLSEKEGSTIDLQTHSENVGVESYPVAYNGILAVIWKVCSLEQFQNAYCDSFYINIIEPCR